MFLLQFFIFFTGSPCTLQSSNSPGQCKLLTECKEIRDEAVLGHKPPQTCDFEGTQTVVCCPKSRQPGDISKKSKSKSKICHHHQIAFQNVANILRLQKRNNYVDTILQNASLGENRLEEPSSRTWRYQDISREILRIDCGYVEDRLSANNTF